MGIPVKVNSIVLERKFSSAGAVGQEVLGGILQLRLPAIKALFAEPWMVRSVVYALCK